MDIKEMHSDLVTKLHDIGIPETDVSIKAYVKNPKGFLGCYRSMSQFKSRPIICIDVEAHERVLKEEGRFTEAALYNNVLETMLHEYGHVIEEYIQFDARSNPDKTFINKLKDFEDMEDFAESFARWLTGREFYSNEEIAVFKELSNFYAEKVFSPESLAWVRQEPWKREVDAFLDIHAKSFKKYETMEGAFNKCMKVTEAVAERLKETLPCVKILRLEGYREDITKAHSKWHKVDTIVHYVLEFNNEWTLDLTAKQFNPDAPNRLWVKTEELREKWDNISVSKDYSRTRRLKAA